MTLNRRQRWLAAAAAICLAVTVGCVLGGVWWWALFGLSEQIGSALFVTAGVSLVLAWVALLAAEEPTT